MSLFDKFLILPAHLWVWIVNKKIIPDRVWDRAMTWRSKK